MQTGASEAASDATQRARTQVVISGTYMEAYTKVTTTTTTGAPTILGRYTIKAGKTVNSTKEETKMKLILFRVLCLLVFVLVFSFLIIFS